MTADDKNRNLHGLGVSFQEAVEFRARHAGQAEIELNDSGLLPLSDAQCVITGSCAQNGVNSSRLGKISNHRLPLPSR